MAHLEECIKRSYVGMRILADRCMQPVRAAEAEETYAVAAA
ncbi:MAG TPA: hypothetical protein VFL63_05560 [Rhodanobacteraceae bacterium]|nr:hypothetical protein [Rhodanobacteraceae bacterium]